MDQQIDHDDLILYLCGELEILRRDQVEIALACDSTLAVQARQWKKVFEFLSKPFIDEDPSPHTFAPEVHSAASMAIQSEDSEASVEMSSKSDTETDQSTPEGLNKQDPQWVSESIRLLKLDDIKVTREFKDSLRNRLIKEIHGYDNDVAGGVQPGSGLSIPKHDSQLISEESSLVGQKTAESTPGSYEWDSYWRDNVFISQDYRLKLRNRLEKELLQDEKQDSVGYIGHKTIWRKFNWVPAGLAAMIAMFLLFIVILYVSKPTPVYALTDIPDRLLELKNLYIKGKTIWFTHGVYEEETTSTPVEMYFERTGRYWRTQNSISYSGYEVSDGQRYMLVNDTDRQCTVGKEIPFRTKFIVESYLQNNIVTQLVGDLSKDYKKVDSQMIDGKKLDIYEQVTETNGSGQYRVKVWFNPSIGLPVKSQWYNKVGTHPERLYGDYDIIQANGVIQNKFFTFDPPKDYEVISTDRKADELLIGLSTSGDKMAILRFAYNINDKAILFCWAFYDRSQTPVVEPALNNDENEYLKLFSDHDNAQWTFKHHILSTDTSQDFHWIWSLVVPTDKNKNINGDIQFQFTHGKPSLNITTRPLRYENGQLEKALFEVQQFARPRVVEAGNAITLEQLDALIDESYK